METSTPADPADAWYGPWAPLSVAEVGAEWADLGIPWWVCGGLAIDAFTGQGRDHGDLDIGIFARDLPVLAPHLAQRWHLWSACRGALRPLNADWPEPQHPLGNIWLRRDATSPWALDILPSPDAAGEWADKRDLAEHAPLDQVTWRDAEGIRYLNPERVLLFKAASPRPKDDRDLRVTVHKLGPDQRTWLRRQIAARYPSGPQQPSGHPWLRILDSC